MHLVAWYKNVLKYRFELKCVWYRKISLFTRSYVAYNQQSTSFIQWEHFGIIHLPGFFPRLFCYCTVSIMVSVHETCIILQKINKM